MTDPKPRRPNDGAKRTSSSRSSGAPKRAFKSGGAARMTRSDGSKRDLRGSGAPKRDGRSSGAPKRTSGGGAPTGNGRRDSRGAGATSRDARGSGAPRRDARSGAPKRAVRSDGTPRRDPRAAGASKRAPRGEGGDSRQMRRDGPQKRTSRGAPVKRTARGDGARKRTSRSSDERSPTRSSVDYPSAKFRRKDGEVEAEAPRMKSSLRKVKRPVVDTSSRPMRERKTAARPTTSTRRRRLKTTEAGDELAKIAGRGARHAQTELARAAEAFSAGRERDAARLLRPLRDAYPDASAVRELLGLSQYRLGQYAAATKELEAFVELSDSVEQHPVLMDCARALGKHRRVDELWEELAAASPSGALVTEGRIVLAGSRADQGRLTEAIALLDRRAVSSGRIQDHHVRVWYALADLYERAGDLPKARELFLRIRAHDAGFADVAERLSTLG